jgi:hypothetical protein
VVLSKVIVACLLDHVLQGDEGGLSLFRVVLRLILHLLEGGERVPDGAAVLARWCAFVLGADETMGEDRLDQLKGALAHRLGAQNATCGLTLAAPLPVAMWVGAAQIRGHLFVGRTRAVAGEGVQ